MQNGIVRREHIGLQGTVLKGADTIAVDELADHVITFTVERREEEDQHTQRHTTYEDLHSDGADIMLHPLLQTVHAAGEIEADQTTDGA